ncbi:MAG: hypothetical protein IAE77_00125, partial [Prosthecobacter sp.]|uniref:hypothetical protein n=1 Tax=Prosthecobacter sp. TaxID=1965333 RepID=UPI0019DCB30D
LVACSTIHRLRALHILLQACMVEWGSTPEHGAEAIKLLGCHPAPSSAFARPNRVGLFYRILADSRWVDKKPEDLKTTIYKKLEQELGISDLNSDPKLTTLVDVVLGADNENATVPWETVKTVFKKLDEELVTSRRNGS